ncbi:unnamed protein product [Pleuronectes platessa]|uniref:Uncharacterized protein n=1 Tax=Pleuronectes platessa TaxID=8262 RepID=A0A9N7YWW6_PLEPL|nr:unnamed protein product [Pleuronectes platessa]
MRAVRRTVEELFDGSTTVAHNLVSALERLESKIHLFSPTHTFHSKTSNPSRAGQKERRGAGNRGPEQKEVERPREAAPLPAPLRRNIRSQADRDWPSRVLLIAMARPRCGDAETDQLPTPNPALNHGSFLPASRGLLPVCSVTHC